jgi:hypothetical protein
LLRVDISCNSLMPKSLTCLVLKKLFVYNALLNGPFHFIAALYPTIRVSALMFSLFLYCQMFSFLIFTEIHEIVCAYAL